MSRDYDSFLRAKVRLAESWGFDVAESEVSPRLKPHQAAMVRWAVQGGRRGIFAAFGLGKSVVQLETVRLTIAKVTERDGTPHRGLIVCPLGVRQEFVRDARNILGWSDAELPRFIRRIEEAGDTGIYLTNYETVRDAKLDPAEFTVVSLDEASILRGFGGTKTFRELMLLCAGDGGPSGRSREQRVAYRYVATATPSPNEYIELLAYAEFLGIMDVSQAKTRFFKRDSTKADNLTLHPHKEREFWLWVASWAIFVQRPSDLGFSDDGYALPAMDVRWHEVGTDHSEAGHEKSGQAKMFRDAAIGVQDAAAEKRNSLSVRVEKLMSIITDERRKTRVSAPILSQESGSPSGRSTRARKAKLSGEPGCVSREVQEVASREPGEVSGANPESCGEESGQDGCSVARVVCSEQEAGGDSGTHGEAEGLRADAGAIRCDATGVAGDVSCLPDRDDASGRGPLPQEREGPGAALPQMQFGSRSLARKSAHPHASSGLPDQVVVWCDLNAEQVAIEKALKAEQISYSSLTGSQSLEEREQLLVDWLSRETSVFLTKPTMYGAGINLQQCHTMVFAGIGFKFCDLIQAIHRIHRFLQTERCTVHLIFTEAEREVRKQLERKWTQHNEMVAKMTSIIREFGLSHAAMAQTLTRKLGVERVEISGPGYRIVNNDCVLETQRMEANSVGLVLTSIPFSSQYEYSPNYADFGHSEGNAEFFQQMDFLTPQLLRVLKPGRIAAIHVKDRVVPMGMSGLGSPTVYPFHAECIRHYTRHGFAYMGMKTIVTDVVRENNQTYRLGWTEQCKDGSKMGVGMPEYLLIFRKPPTDRSNSYADEPVVKSKGHYSRARWQTDAHAFTRSSGNRSITPEELRHLPHSAIFQIFKKHSLENVYDYEHHVKIGETLEADGQLPSDFMLLQPQSWSDEVWADVTRMLTLNSSQSQKGAQMHLCPMQFDIADRAITQFTNVGDVVFDPFGGLMTVPYRAIKLRRFGVASELNAAYFLDGAHYCKAASEEMTMPALFDLTQYEAEQLQPTGTGGGA